jgi:signal transduction histidine kinase/CheY-like chemotaxis protein
MWYTLRRSPKADPDFASSANELLQSTSRNLILATSGVYLIWQLLVADELPGQLGPAFVPITAVIVLTCVLSLRLLRKWLLAAQAVWQVGVAAAITLTICLFRHPEIAFLYALLPLMAVVTLGWPAGLLAEGLVIGLLWWLVHSSAMLPLSNSYAIAITASGVLTGLVGWAAMHTLLTVTQWALFSFEQARQKIEEAREQRLELKQIQQDLIQANGELARLSDRLKAMHRAAEEARRAKEEFVANVSHELRTPLNMIIGFSEMIIQSPQVYGARLPSALLADITAIRRNSQHLAKLVDDVLDLSQVEAGRMALSKELVSLQGIVDEVATAVRGLYESKGLYLQTEVPADLPPILCDSTRIRQVMLNLLSNAGRFTERGGVRLNAWREKDNVVVSVSDTGPGIAPEDQEKIFEPFQQLDGSIRRRHGGSGLGLSISKRFVEMHRGKMWLESEVGVGTTFYFSLPLEMPLPAALTGGDDARRWFSPYHGYEFRVRTRRSKAPAPVLVPRYVIVEEGETLQQLLSRYADDIEVIPFRDIDEAIRDLSRSPAQALILNGSPFEETPAPADQLANLPYGTPAMTCWVPGEDKAARRLGVVRYLAKPVTREMLLSTLGHLGKDVKSVLLVDDQPEVLQLFSRMLSSAEPNYDILLAKNGRRALGLLRERQPDVMLLDLIMPGMSGFRVLQEKERDPSIRDIPVVVISARDPSGEPVASDTLTVTRGGGLSVRDLVACIQAISEILFASVQPGGLGWPERSAA